MDAARATRSRLIARNRLPRDADHLGNLPLRCSGSDPDRATLRGRWELQAEPYLLDELLGVGHGSMVGTLPVPNRSHGTFSDTLDYRYQGGTLPVVEMTWRATEDQGAVGVGPVPGHEGWQVAAEFRPIEGRLVLASIAIHPVTDLPYNGLTGTIMKAVTVQRLVASLESWQESNEVEAGFARLLATYGGPPDERGFVLVERSFLPEVVEMQLSPDASLAASGILPAEEVVVEVEGESTTIPSLPPVRRPGRPGRPEDHYAYLAALYVNEVERSGAYGARARIARLLGRTSTDVGHQLDRAADLNLLSRSGRGSGEDRFLKERGRQLTGEGALTRRQLLSRTRSRWKDPR